MTEGAGCAIIDAYSQMTVSVSGMRKIFDARGRAEGADGDRQGVTCCCSRYSAKRLRAFCVPMTQRRTARRGAV